MFTEHIAAKAGHNPRYRKDTLYCTLVTFPTHGRYAVVAALRQVATGSMDRDRDSTGGGDSKEITGLKFKVVECQVHVDTAHVVTRNIVLPQSSHLPLPWISGVRIRHHYECLWQALHTSPIAGSIQQAW